jgi:hypothetical protein
MYASEFNKAEQYSRLSAISYDIEFHYIYV